MADDRTPADQSPTDIIIEDYEEGLREYVCPVCSERFTDHGRLSRHLTDHSFSSEKTVTKQRFITPCGCKFLSMKEAELHIAINKKICGYYYKNTEHSGKGLLKILHVEGTSNSYGVPWKGFELTKEFGRWEMRGTSYTHSSHLGSARSDSKIPIIVIGFKKIDETIFRMKFAEFASEMENDVVRMGESS